MKIYDGIGYIKIIVIIQIQKRKGIGNAEKSCTIKIPKSKLLIKQNKIDLRTSKIAITGDFANASF